MPLQQEVCDLVPLSPPPKPRVRGCICCKAKHFGRPPIPSEVQMSPTSEFGDGADPICEMGLSTLVFSLSQAPEHCERISLESTAAQRVANLACERAMKLRTKAPAENDSRVPLAMFEWNELEIGRVLGTGGFSEVFEIREFKDGEQEPHHSPPPKAVRVARDFLRKHAVRKPQEGETSESNPDHHVTRYAVKCLRPTLLRRPSKFCKAAMDLACESEILRSLDHPNIVKLRGEAIGGPAAFKAGEHNSYFLIVDRLVETLEDRVWFWRKQWKAENNRDRPPTRFLRGLRSKRNQKNQIEFTDEPMDALMVERLGVSRDLASALEYLHERRIIYRDLKTSNVGFDVRGNVRLFDFGLSRFLPQPPVSRVDNEYLYDLSIVGALRYMAPEVVAEEHYNQKADVYSLGVVFWEVFTMSSPPKCSFSMAPCPCWPLELRELVDFMLSASASGRPSMKSVATALTDIIQLNTGEGSSSDGLKTRRRSTFRLENFQELEDLVELDNLSGGEDGAQSNTTLGSCLSSAHET